MLRQHCKQPEPVFNFHGKTHILKGSLFHLTLTQYFYLTLTQHISYLTQTQVRNLIGNCFTNLKIMTAYFFQFSSRGPE